MQKVVRRKAVLGLEVTLQTLDGIVPVVQGNSVFQIIISVDVVQVLDFGTVFEDKTVFRIIILGN